MTPEQRQGLKTRERGFWKCRCGDLYLASDGDGPVMHQLCQKCRRAAPSRSTMRDVVAAPDTKEKSMLPSKRKLPPGYRWDPENISAYRDISTSVCLSEETAKIAQAEIVEKAWESFEESVKPILAAVIALLESQHPGDTAAHCAEIVKEGRWRAFLGSEDDKNKD